MRKRIKIKVIGKTDHSGQFHGDKSYQKRLVRKAGYDLCTDESRESKENTLISDKISFPQVRDFLLSIINSTPYGIIVWDFEGFISMANTQALVSLGLTGEMQDIVDRPILEVVGPVNKLSVQIKSCIEKDRKDFDIDELNYNDKYLRIQGRKILDGMIITIIDFTPAKESEQESLNSLLKGQEMERQRLSRDIHDGVGPLLSTIKINLSNLEADLRDFDDSIPVRFEQSYQMIDELAKDLRAISHNLMPKVLQDFGLVEAVETLCARIRENRNISVDFVNSTTDLELSKIKELGIYRVVQELFSNTLKHANASKVTLQLVEHVRTLILVYEDDGVGFKVSQIHSGIGLSNVHTRATALAGRVLIDSRPGKGMTVTLEVPLD